MDGSSENAADVVQRQWSKAALASELRGDGPHVVSADGVDLVVVRRAGRLKAYEGRCPHQGALLGEGELDRGMLVCRNHRWRFDADTGARQGGSHCLSACPIVEEEGEIRVDVRALARQSRPSAPAEKRVADLPGPRGLPIVGNAFQIDGPTMHLLLELWARTYGPMYKFRLGSLEAVVVSDPDLREQV